jgi:hypothetical protein
LWRRASTTPGAPPKDECSAGNPFRMQIDKSQVSLASGRLTH